LPLHQQYNLCRREDAFYAWKIDDWSLFPAKRLLVVELCDTQALLLLLLLLLN